MLAPESKIPALQKYKRLVQLCLKRPIRLAVAFFRYATSKCTLTRAFLFFCVALSLLVWLLTHWLTTTHSISLNLICQETGDMPPRTQWTSDVEMEHLLYTFSRFNYVVDRSGDSPNVSAVREETSSEANAKLPEDASSRLTSRVRFVVVPRHGRLRSTSMNTLALSALIAGIPIQILGAAANETMEEVKRVAVASHHVLKWRYIERFIELDHLKDHDVLVMVEEHAVFSGDDPVPVLEAFLATTPRTASDGVEWLKVRAHQLRPPVLFATQESCQLPSVVDSEEECRARFEWVEGLWEGVASSRSKASASGSDEKNRTPWPASEAQADVEWYFEKNTVERQRNTRIYPNSAVMVGRVWAIQEMLDAMRLYEQSHFPRHRDQTQQAWSREGGVLGELLLQLQRYELRSPTCVSEYRSPPASSSEIPSAANSSSRCDTRKSSPERALKSPLYGLTPGVLGLDYSQEIAMSVSVSPAHMVRRGYVGGVSVTTGRQALSRATAEVRSRWKGILDSYQKQRRRSTATPHEQKTDQRIHWSPTNVLLASDILTADSPRRPRVSPQSSRTSYYTNQSLVKASSSPSATGTTPTMDVSVPLALHSPLVYYFLDETTEQKDFTTHQYVDSNADNEDGWQRSTLYQMYLTALPWVLPLQVEGKVVAGHHTTTALSKVQNESRQHEKGHATASWPGEGSHSQFVSLMRLVTNAPPLQVWRREALASETNSLYQLQNSPEFIPFAQTCSVRRRT